MRVLVTGAEGMLGQEVVRAMGAGHDVISTDVLGDCRRLDITNASETFSVISDTKPDVVVHCAAMTDVDGCSRNPDAAYKVNAIGASNLACACADNGSEIVYVSTDYVFDGDKGEPYTEFDPVCPTSAYGASKLAGEIAVKETCRQFYIVRTSWLFAPHSKNFPLSILRAAAEGKELKIVSDQIGSPTYAPDLAETIASIAGSRLYGTYHFTNSGSCSWYEFARSILDTAGISNVSIKPISSDDWPTPTKRPKYSVLRNYRLELLGKDTARSWEETVVEFVKAWTTAKQ